MRLTCAFLALSLASGAAVPARAQNAHAGRVAVQRPARAVPPVASRDEVITRPQPAPDERPTPVHSGWRSARRILLHTGVGALAGGVLGAWAGHAMHQRMAYIGPDPGRHRRWMLQIGAGAGAVGGVVGTVVGMAREARTDDRLPAPAAGGR